MLEKRLREIGQDHIADLVKAKSPYISLKRLEQDLGQIDSKTLMDLIEGKGIFIPPEGKMQPPDVVPADFAHTKDAKVARERGEDLISQGRVAVVMVAGGQGSRLGLSGPKGALGISPVKKKSLFQLHSEKILALKKRYNKAIPFLIMTSRSNDADTRRFFEDNAFFGLGRDEVYFFVQGMMPSITAEGRLIISRDGGLFMNPDGHGGTLDALKKSGLLGMLGERGVDLIFYFQVDNPLVKMCDPLFLGLHVQKDAQMSSKVVEKRNFDEKVGVIAVVDGKTRVIEYSDLKEEFMYMEDDEGRPVYRAGSIAIHLFDRAFIEAITIRGVNLPYHKAVKNIPTIDQYGRPVEIKGIKFEKFIFDALPFAERALTLEVKREQEFAPVKNKTGQDSIESAISLQDKLFRSWLARAGRIVEDGIKVEISPLFALDEEDLLSKASALPSKIEKDLYIE
ncbi:MAG: UDPGP type 1 family protein [Deltaproteobacteria bacterium]|nr:UDPGP type 1 family protein [Deltaproteobacteria bacterium]